MKDWTRLDSQVRRYSPYLRDELSITPPDSNALATTIAQEICALPRDAIRELLSDSNVEPKNRLDELVAFQSFMDMANACPTNPGLARAQVITQNYSSFVYLGDACFKALRSNAALGAVTKHCCEFLTDNPVRAFRNAVAHANWKYQPDFSGLIFWARKGSGATETLTRFEVCQRDLDFWQALARCVAYVAYTEATASNAD